MKYKTILADPPWSYRSTACQGSVDDHYKTMTVNDIQNMPIRDIVSGDSVLILWCTWPQIKEGISIIDSWGFEYVTGFPWIKIRSVSTNLWGKTEIKVPYGVGYWARGCSEMVLIGKKGNAKPPQNHDFLGLLSPNVYHSRKPDDIYEYAESLPGPYLELFARRKREGWDVFGNEVEGSIDLETIPKTT